MALTQLKLVLGMTIVVSATGFNFRVLLPVLASGTLHAGAEVFGVLFACFGAGALLGGVRYIPNGAVTDSIVMRSRSGTVRRVEATHLLDKLEAFTGREFR